MYFKHHTITSSQEAVCKMVCFYKRSWMLMDIRNVYLRLRSEENDEVFETQHLLRCLLV